MRWAVCTLLLCGMVLGQTPSPLLTFEAASVKVAQRGMSGLKGGPGTPNPGQLVGQSVSLFALVMEAWGIRPYQVSGLTGNESEVYDVIAKVPAGSTKDDSRLMLQRLLLERFGLVVHHERQEMPVFELTIAKGGLKIKEVAAPTLDSSAAAAASKDGPKLNSNKFAQPYNGHLRIVATNMPARGLAGMMQMQAGRPVVDKTGLNAYYDFTLEFAADGLSAPPPGVNLDDPAPDFFTAIVKQLGLKLDPKKEPVDTLHIDRFNRVPTEN